MNSVAVGTSGSAGPGAADVTARGRSLPVRTNSIEAGSGSIITCTCPASISTSAGAAPRYGTCTMLMPVSILSSSANVLRRAHSGGGVIDLGGICFLLSDEIRECVRRYPRMHLHYQRGAGE